MEYLVQLAEAPQIVVHFIDDPREWLPLCVAQLKQIKSICFDLYKNVKSSAIQLTKELLVWKKDRFTT